MLDVFTLCVSMMADAGKDVCHALGIDVTPKETEGIRAMLERLANRHILTEDQPGLFSL